MKEHEWLFLDADMKVNSVVFSEEVLDDDKDFVSCPHHDHYNGTGDFERRPESEACVTGNPLQYYQVVCGVVNGSSHSYDETLER